jgi:S-adenosylmethionine hydrolase
LKQLGIEPGNTFTLVAGERSYPVLYGKSFESVPKGEWVGFAGPESNFIIAINYDNAGAISGLRAGAVVTLRPLKRP